MQETPENACDIKRTGIASRAVDIMQPCEHNRHRRRHNSSGGKAFTSGFKVAAVTFMFLILFSVLVIWKK